MISRTVLIAVEPFGEELGPARVAAAIGRGVQAGDPTLAVDSCPIEAGEGVDAEDVRTLLESLDFDTRMRAARAVILGVCRLDEGTLLGSATFEIATRARQAGVPAYAVAGENRLSLFDARILDLQVIVEAVDVRALRRAGEKLAGMV
ncbi:MAG TPA: glycerate kinase [Solirubrobacteraceae bacterium]|nr:glycerate kinase [Solirubrobacteraceae bacterium]